MFFIIFYCVWVLCVFGEKKKIKKKTTTPPTQKQRRQQNDQPNTNKKKQNPKRPNIALRQRPPGV
ncbi:hypothetical protein, partial [Escherichia coli]|uniref:hypothetical protein n=1 Tax=Escherichia coli TaxID=562 RepID=UPI0021C761BA